MDTLNHHYFDRADSGPLSDHLGSLAQSLDRLLRFEHGDCRRRASGWTAGLDQPLPRSGIGIDGLLEEMAEHLVPNGPPLPYGGYLIWHLGPEVKVAVDGRNLTVYDDEWVDRYLRALRAGTAHEVLDEGAVDAWLLEADSAHVWLVDDEHAPRAAGQRHLRGPDLRVERHDRVRQQDHDDEQLLRRGRRRSPRGQR